MVSYLYSLASSSFLDQVPFHPSSPITIPQICEIRPHVLGSALVWGQEGIREEVDLLQRCDEMVSKLGLFSSNETKEDVSTPTSSSYSYGSPSLLLLEFHLHFISACVRNLSALSSSGGVKCRFGITIAAREPARRSQRGEAWRCLEERPTRRSTLAGLLPWPALCSQQTRSSAALGEQIEDEVLGEHAGKKGGDSVGEHIGGEADLLSLIDPTI
ncbi:hypothetical protein ACQ4PT_029789 [Festuca glaucescens]